MEFVAEERGGTDSSTAHGPSARGPERPAAIPERDRSPAAPPAAPTDPPLRLILVVADLLMLMTGWILAVVAVEALTGRAASLVEAFSTGVVATLVGLMLLRANGLHRRRVTAVPSREFARIVGSVLGLALMVGLVRLPAGGEVAVFTAGVAGLAWLLLLGLERALLREWIATRRAHGEFGAPIVVLAGSSYDAIETVDFLVDNPFLGFEVRGVVCPYDPRLGSTGDVSWCGDRLPGSDALRAMGATGVFIDTRGLNEEDLNRTVQALGEEGLHVHLSSGLRGVERRRITVSPLVDETFLHIAPIALSKRQLAAKRALDLVLGTVALVVLSPVLLVAMALVWLYDRGPVLFRQERVGLGGELFEVYKLRTMVVDAEARKQHLERNNERDGPLFKLARDPRVTPVGRFLRASSIDELPQLFNVLRGEMGLVGPRPALPAEVASFDAELNRRLGVKPGITGLWQVEARDLPNFDLYRRFDLLYVRNWSLGLDLSVIARTVVVVALRGLSALGVGRRGATPATD